MPMWCDVVLRPSVNSGLDKRKSTSQYQGKELCLEGLVAVRDLRQFGKEGKREFEGKFEVCGQGTEDSLEKIASVVWCPFAKKFGSEHSVQEEKFDN